MPPSKTKRGESWTEEQLQNAMEAVSKRNFSQRKAATTYGIPRRTLRNHLKSGKTTKKYGRSSILSTTQENELVTRIKRLAQIGLPLSTKIIRKQAFVFCKVNNIPNCFNDVKSIAGKKWLSLFLKRHPDISLRKAQFMNPARAQKMNKHIVEQHFTEIKRLFDELDIPNHPERLYNMDEKGCRLTLHHQQRVLAAKGAKRVHFVAQEHAENVTIAMCVNAAGMAIPPMIIFKGKRHKPEYDDNLPAGGIVKMAPKGSMTTEIFIDFIKHFSKYKPSGKCLLIFDGASSHLDIRIVDAADENNVVLYCLPSNTTHELQPLDKSVNKSYEHYWDEEVLLYSYQHPDKRITKSRFNKIFSRVWLKCMTQENIVNGFKATGLYPYNPSAIPEEAFAPSILTQRELQNEIQNTARCSVTFPNDSDIDLTDCEDAMNDSPSVLVDENDAGTVNINTQIQNINSNARSKLVEYSSSSESANNDIQRNEQCNRFPLTELNSERSSQFLSPIPSTSGLPAQRRPVIHFSSSDSEQEDIDMTYFQYPRNIRIYTSTSESEGENLVTQSEKTYTLESKHDKDESEDEIPLSTIKKVIEPPIVNTFHKQIPTPNFTKVKTTPRRKALNYIGQRVTKDLFEKKAEEDAKKKEITKKKAKPKNVIKNTRKSEPKKKKESHKQKKKSKDEWFCKACKTKEQIDMRQCYTCKVWYHDICIGYTKADKDLFICPEC